MKAVEIMPDFGLTLPPATTTWTTDRYDPTSFSNVGLFQGRDDVLGIGITSAGDLTNRLPGYQSSFYNTQGRQNAAIGGAGTTLSADLWIDSSWSDASNGSVRTDVWGVMTDNTAVSAYPILGFTNYGATARFRYYESNVGTWVDLNTVVNYNAWNSLSIGFTGSAFTYTINGVLVGTVVDGNGSTGFTNVIMQAYNFADPSISGATPQDYTAHWSNTQGVPDGGATIGLFALSLAGLVLLRRRLVS